MVLERFSTCLEDEDSKEAAMIDGVTIGVGMSSSLLPFPVFFGNAKEIARR